MNNRVIYVQWTNGYGGLEKVTQCYEERFSYLNPLVLPLRYSSSDLEYKNCYALKKEKGIAFILEYFLFVRRFRDCYFHLQYISTTFLLITYLAGARKIIFHFHGTKFPNRFYNKLIWRLLEDKVKIIANSLFTKQIIVKKLGIQNQITIIPNLINTEDFIFQERNYNQKERFIISYAGRFDKGKNIDLILESAKILLQKHDEIQFLLVGDGPEKRNIQQKIKEDGLESIVQILPYTKYITGIYRQSHLFIFTSLYESFGNVVAEAILTGLPILCFRIPALEELIKDNSFFFDKQNSQLIVNKIIDIKANYQTIKIKLKQVNEFLREYLNNEKIINKLDLLYKSFDY